MSRPFGSNRVWIEQKFRFQDIPIQKEQCAKRHILRGCGDISFHRQMSQISGHFRSAQMRRMSAMMKRDEAADVLYVGLLGSQT